MRSAFVNNLNKIIPLLYSLYAGPFPKQAHATLSMSKIKKELSRLDLSITFTTFV